MAASPPVSALPWYDRHDYPVLLKLFAAQVVGERAGIAVAQHAAQTAQRAEPSTQPGGAGGHVLYGSRVYVTNSGWV
jgi:hypothetical protein